MNSYMKKVVLEYLSKGKIAIVEKKYRKQGEKIDDYPFFDPKSKEYYEYERMEIPEEPFLLKVIDECLLDEGDFLFVKTEHGNLVPLKKTDNLYMEMLASSEEKRRQEELDRRAAQEEKRRQEELDRRAAQEEKRRQEELDRRAAQKEKEKQQKQQEQSNRIKNNQQNFNRRTDTVERLLSTIGGLFGAGGIIGFFCFLVHFFRHIDETPFDFWGIFHLSCFCGGIIFFALFLGFSQTVYYLHNISDNLNAMHGKTE